MKEAVSVALIQRVGHSSESMNSLTDGWEVLLCDKFRITRRTPGEPALSTVPRGEERKKLTIASSAWVVKGPAMRPRSLSSSRLSMMILRLSVAELRLGKISDLAREGCSFPGPKMGKPSRILETRFGYRAVSEYLARKDCHPVARSGVTMPKTSLLKCSGVFEQLLAAWLPEPQSVQA